MGLSQQEYWSGLPCPPPGDLPDPGIEPVSPASPKLQADSLPLSHRGSLAEVIPSNTCTTFSKWPEVGGEILHVPCPSVERFWVHTTQSLRDSSKIALLFSTRWPTYYHIVVSLPPSLVSFLSPSPASEITSQVNYLVDLIHILVSRLFFRELN